MTETSQQTLRRLLKDNELWGVAEVCEALGTTTGNLGRWPNLPEPVMRVRATRLWLADDIRQYQAQRVERDEARMGEKDVVSQAG
jgi:prophage antirepressor-like protein